MTVPAFARVCVFRSTVPSSVFFSATVVVAASRTGSAHAANLFSRNGQLHWLAGREQVETFQLAGTRFEKSFCSLCGSALPTVQAGGRLLVPAGSLDSPLDQRADAHIFVASRALWDRDLHGLPAFAERPPVVPATPKP